MTMPDVDKIIRYENGEMDTAEVLDLFADLIKSGLAWSLQGSYGRAAASLIEGGLITPEGEITERGHTEAEEN
jgi:hypothetical protein